MKKFLASLLVLALSVSTALAVTFPTLHPDPSFWDVAPGAWYEPAILTCCRTGLMKGTGNGFAPTDPMTIAEVAMLSARIHELENGGDGIIENPADAPLWFVGAMTYMHKLAVHTRSLDIPLSQPMQNATRNIFFDMLALVVPDAELVPINQITHLPDTQNASVLKFYNAGILTGVDAYGTFRGHLSLTRAEAAAMVARIVRPELRRSFVPKDPNPITITSTLQPETPMIILGDTTITAEQYLYRLAAELDTVKSACVKKGIAFGWDIVMGSSKIPLTEYATTRALATCSRYAVIPLEANALGIPFGKREQSLTATRVEQFKTDHGVALMHDLNASCITLQGITSIIEAEVLADSMIENFICPENTIMDDYMAAKHILVADKQTASAICAQLKKDPSEANFDRLMKENSRDPALASYPNGYLFTSNQMVREFEKTTLSLGFNSISAPVKSEFGYHIIMRLNPRTPAFARTVLDSRLQLRLQSLKAMPTDAYHNLDVKTFYENLEAYRSAIR
ncbi:MAG: peptidylprolyl isomerase [Evtepia sp.]